MKKLFIALTALMVTASAYGQGEILFNTFISGQVDAKVLLPNGTPAGAGFTAQLFGGPLGTAEAALVPLTPTTTFRPSGGGMGYVIQPADTVKVPGVAAGGQATVQLRAFDGATFGASSIKGQSNLIPLTLGGGTILPANLTGLNGFTMVPEPSTIALAIAGAGLLLFRRRK